MTWTRQTTLWCDEDDCPEWFQESGTVKRVEKQARGNGWTASGGNHYCPKHNSK